MAAKLAKQKVHRVDECLLLSESCTTIHLSKYTHVLLCAWTGRVKEKRTRQTTTYRCTKYNEFYRCCCDGPPPPPLLLVKARHWCSWNKYLESAQVDEDVLARPDHIPSLYRSMEMVRIGQCLSGTSSLISIISFDHFFGRATDSRFIQWYLQCWIQSRKPFYRESSCIRLVSYCVIVQVPLLWPSTPRFLTDNDRYAPTPDHTTTYGVCRIHTKLCRFLSNGQRAIIKLQLIDKKYLTLMMHL